MANRSTKRRDTPRRSGPREGYLADTQRPLNSLTVVGPIMIAFHLGFWLSGATASPYYPLNAILGYFGAAAWLISPVIVVAVLLIQHAFRRDRWRIQPLVAGGIVAEGIAWTVPLMALRYVRDATLAASTSQPATDDFAQKLFLEIGSGIYEEFVFRLVLIGLLLVLAVDVFSAPEGIATGAAVVVSATIFALAHFDLGIFGGRLAFNWPQFLFLAPAGVLWGTLLVYRGFGVAVVSHVAWNVFHLLTVGSS